MEAAGDDGIGGSGSRSDLDVRIRARRTRVALVLGILTLAASFLPWLLFRAARPCDMSDEGGARLACNWDVNAPQVADKCHPTTLGHPWLDYVVFTQIPFCLVAFVTLRWQVRRRDPPPSKTVMIGFDGVLLGFIVAFMVLGFGLLSGERLVCWTRPDVSLGLEVAIGGIAALASGVVLGLPLGLLSALVFHLAERPLRRAARGTPPPPP